ncbi:ABC transporter ATP-binding protein [Brachybacterium saurashtrense]|uniref:ABC transporter ATP-binding protein n=1 Tax=Brachybacterium saurashtrense TaxID=556288 RepID=A0A345YP35_9MICO|nr:ABC transporter ATP-binding protein [Brachybacterium saurashtrense]AXK45687.1 ABC transporter ATP-binding protein [Brachybacterium saurashtrense]RRR24704.1 ABC transporter ATP-binding protein [Brachybacterium saurashtrense]
MDADVLQITGLTRRYGRVIANDDISLRVRAGEVVGLLGHNGAGKTTLVSQVVGLLRPGGGRIRVGGADAVRDPAAARRHVALQPQAQAPIDGLTPRAAIEIAGRLRGMTVRDARRAAIDLAEELDIGPWLDRRALPEGGGLSGGIRRLTAFAMAVAAPTALLILDEPTNDIDASRRRLLWDAVRRRGDRGSGVLLVTHNVAEAERVVDELVVLDRGCLVAEGSPASLRGTQDTDLRLELRLSSDAEDPSAADPHLPARRRVRAGRRTLLTVAAHDAAEAVAWAAARRAEGRVESYSLAPVTLEDAYLALTARSASGTDAEPTPSPTRQEADDD